jgi:ATP-dependent protease ClpP protease subunit
MARRDGNRFYIGDFDESLSGIESELRDEIDRQARWSSKGGGLIELYIGSYGGDAHLMFRIVELVELAKRKGVTVRTIVWSHAYSAGSVLAVAGTKGERYIARTAEHLPHYGTFGGYRIKTPQQIDRTSEQYRRWTGHLLAHYKKHANIPDLEEHLKDDMFFIPADKAIEWGLADKYTDEWDGEK